MKIGLFFGSFNPIHIGHLAIANYMVEYSDIDQLWFIISPQNPFKKKSSLLADYHRLEMVNMAIADYPKFRASDIEFKLPKPSFSIDTLAYLHEKYPQHSFVLIIGSDQLPTFDKWKNFEEIIANYTRYIYPRPGSEKYRLNPVENAQWFDAPRLDISSSFVRQSIKQKKELSFFLPPRVFDYIRQMHFYEK